MTSLVAQPYCAPMRIRYNAPVTLTFALLAATVLIVDSLTTGTLTLTLFSVGATMDVTNILDYPRLFLHVLGHQGWSHLMGNMAFILLLGPILEEKHGSGSLLFMMFVTALVTGILNVLVFSTGLLGASGVVFMMILLVSFTNIKRGEIPLTFILVVILYLAQEVVLMLNDDQISQFAHIIGGIIGSVFGFVQHGRGLGDSTATSDNEEISV